MRARDPDRNAVVGVVAKLVEHAARHLRLWVGGGGRAAATANAANAASTSGPTDRST